MVSKMNIVIIIAIHMFSVVICGHNNHGDNLLSNGEFEESFSGNWYCNTCLLSQSRESYTGKSSGYVSKRKSTSSGVTQYVNVKPGRKYYFKARLKMLGQQEGAAWHVSAAMLKLESIKGDEYILVSRLPIHQQDHGWVLLAGDIDLRYKEFSRASVYIQVNHRKVNYLLDTASLVELLPNDKWKQEADMRIDAHRKGNVKLRLMLDSTRNPDQIEIKLEMKRQAFAFGSAVQAGRLNRKDELNKRYQEFFYKNFEWATIENHLKWHKMERKKGKIDVTDAEFAIEDLAAHGFVKCKDNSAFSL